MAAYAADRAELAHIRFSALVVSKSRLFGFVQKLAVQLLDGWRPCSLLA